MYSKKKKEEKKEDWSVDVADVEYDVVVVTKHDVIITACGWCRRQQIVDMVSADNRNHADHVIAIMLIMTVADAAADHSYRC